MPKNENLPAKYNDLSTTDEFTERLMLKKFLTDDLFANFISENVDSDCFSNGVIKKAIEIGIAYRKKGFSAPLTVNLLTEIMKGSGCSEESKLLPSYANLQQEVDDDFAKDLIRKYVQGKKLFSLVFANSAELMKAKNFAPVMEGLGKIASIEFQTDLGFNYLKDIKQHVEYLRSPDNKFSVGYSELDRIMNGGLPKEGKCLLVLMAEAGLGKSMMMHNMAANMVKDGKKVLIVSLEMTEQIYASRFSANFTECNINELGFDGNIDKVITVASELSSLHPDAGLVIKEFPPSSLRPIALSSYISRLIMSGWKPDVVFVDYLNIMVPNNSEKGDSSYIKVGEVCKELRALSYKFTIPFVTATQTNRNGMGNANVDMSNISESTQTAHHTDGLFALTRDEEEMGLIKLTVLKNRFGGKVGSQIKFMFNPDNLILTQCTELSNGEQSELERIAEEVALANPNS